MLDPLTHAVRSDLADVRLADRVFAPHYAAPMERRIVAECPLHGAPGTNAAVIARMAEGDSFDVLEISGTLAWGIATREGLVGYVSTAAVEGLGA